MDKNMKRLANVLIVSSITLALTAGLYGCGANVNAETSDMTSSSVEDSLVQEDGLDSSESDESSKKTVYGEVTEVIGNWLLLKVIESPQIFSGNFERSDMNSVMIDGKTIQEMMEEAGGEEAFREQMQQRMSERMSGQGGDGQAVTIQPGEGQMFSGQASEGRTFSGQTGEGRTFSGQAGEGQTFDFQPGEGRAERVFRGEGGEGVPAMVRNYTGEEIEVIIPVGIPVTTTTMSQSGATETEVKMESVKAGNLMLITYAEDGETVESAVLMQETARAGRGQNGGAGAVTGTIIGDLSGGGDVTFFRIDEGGGGRP